MADPNFLPGRISLQPASVDFIDNRLPRYHPAFANAPVRYDAMSGGYVPNSQALTATSSEGHLASPGALAAPLDEDGFPARPEYTNTNAMVFWNAIFPDAVLELVKTTEPRGRSETEYSIRAKANWDDIYDVLKSARAKYEKSGGPVGWLRKMRRKAADKIAPVTTATKITAKLVPSNPYATPVLAAVEILFDAVKTAASVRGEVLEGLKWDELVHMFSDVEVFLGDHPKDVKVRKVSVDLITATLTAVEQAIGFFISNEFARGAKVMLLADSYEKELRDSLTKIKAVSKDLMEEALKSHMYEANKYSQETYKLLRRVDQTAQKALVTFNAMEALLTEYAQQRERLIESLRQENSTLRVENGILRASSPFQPGMAIAPPPQGPPAKWYMSQEALRRMLDIPDLDMADMAFVDGKQHELPEPERVLAEQAVNTQLFRNWIVSPSSAKLLLHWGSSPPTTVAGVSPLSVFCRTMAQALRARERFVSLVWFCGRHVGDEDDDDDDDGDEAWRRRPPGGRTMLASLIDQLLRQHVFDTSDLGRGDDVHLGALQAGQPAARAALLTWLVRRLPATTTVFCLVDGVALYEREEFEGEALSALSALLRLTVDGAVAAAVKVLFASTPSSDVVRGAFERVRQEDLILEVAGLPLLSAAASEERMARELGAGLGGMVVEELED